MLQGALVGLAAKAKAASAKVGDVVGDLLDNSVDNPLYEDDEEAEWSEDGDDEDEEDLEGTDDGIDSPAPAPTQSSALAQLRARLAAERAKKAGDASEARAEPSSSATRGLTPAEPGSLRPCVPNGSLPPAPPTPVAPLSTTAPPPPPPPPQPEVTTPTMTPVRPPQPPRAAAAVASPTSGVVGVVPSVVPTSPGGTPIAASMSALEQRARAAEEETARLRRRIDADARAAETEKQRAVAAAVAEAMEREQRKAAAMMEAMVEADGAASAAHDAATIGALREELRAVRAAAGDAEATWAGRLEEAAAGEEELRRRLIRAEERATAAEAEAAAARAGEDDNGAEAEELRDALARERARAREEIEARDAEIEKNQKELVRLRHHLLELEEEDDAKAEEAELNAEALVREREEEHAATVNDLTARLAAAERELEVTRRAVDAKDRELANLQVAMDIFNTDEEARGRLSLEAQALREKNAHLAAELVVAKEQVTAANARASGAECDARAEKERADAAAAETQRAIGEAGKARQALQQSMQQAKHLMASSTELLDKRIVSKLLLTYFEREQSPDVLELMARMLNMSEDEKSKMGLGERAAAKPGLIRSVATAPVRVAFGALGFAGTVAKTALQSPVHVARALTPEEEKQTVADQWVEFLLSQMDAADEDEIAGKKFKVQPIAAPATPGP